MLAAMSRWAVAMLLLSMVGACAPDVVEPNAYQRDAAAVSGPAAGGNGGAPGPDAAPAGEGGVGPADGGGAQAPARDCDLTGRWLVAQRVLAVAIGQEQAAQSWFYWEVDQQGADLVIRKGLHCGFAVVKKTSLAATVDSSAAWPALLTRNTSTGRKGRFVAEGNGCHLTLEREVVVRGASLPHYADTKNKLPGRMEKAEAGRPGWEDWDGDGQPGISLKVTSSLASGTLYTCQRDFTVYDGPTEARATKLKVAVSYGGEQVPLGRSAGSAQAIESGSSPSSDPAQHFAILHRLSPEQAMGDDASICAEVRSLRERLAPEAGK
jgi:hypothetical protein